MVAVIDAARLLHAAGAEFPAGVMQAKIKELVMTEAPLRAA
jgi:hypothetical protein